MLDKAMIRRLPDSELEVMLVIWHAREPVTRPELDEKLREKGWAVTTINTYLTRLLEKGFLACERQGKCNRYTPLIDEQEYLDCESRTFLEKLCGNSVKNFVASAIRNQKLEDAEIDELQRYLDALKRRDSDG